MLKCFKVAWGGEGKERDCPSADPFPQRPQQHSPDLLYERHRQTHRRKLSLPASEDAH